MVQITAQAPGVSRVAGFGVRAWLIAGGLAMVAAASVATPARAADKEPPACAAITFRPVSSGLADGNHDAGLYKSKFAKIELQATLKGGEPANYFLQINGKTPDPLKDIPKGIDGCLKSKHIAVPATVQPAGACTGSRFRVVIWRAGNSKSALLYGLHGDKWDLCSINKV